jgi:DNA-binding XRE family transcriptional regulator
MYDINVLLRQIEKAVEVEQWTTYERIAKQADINIISLWKIRNGKQSPTLKTANKIAVALEELKSKKSI